MTTPAPALLLVTASGCHLCEHARGVLEELGVAARVVDVSSPEVDALAARGVPLPFIPVLTDGNRVIAYGRFSARRLRHELAP